MRKALALIVILGGIAAAGWFFWDSGLNNATSMVKQYVDNGEISTFKARFTPEQIMDNNRKELLVDSMHAYKDPEVKYIPYILMEVKYVPADKRSREGMVLWSLIDGEMILSTDSWEKTHGYEDAIESGATRTDFRIIHAIAKNRGSITMDQLEKELHVEKDTLYPWIDSAVSKHLIIKKGNELQLHFQDPKLVSIPETKINEGLVKKPYAFSQRISKKYSANQIEKISKAAFGEDFTIRNSTEVFLPVYMIHVLNPDGSVYTTLWNAVNGQKITTRPSF